MKRRALILLSLFAALICGAAAPGAAAPPRLLVFAAASLQGPLDRAARAFERADAEKRIQVRIQVRIAYASSGILARQIARGAPADLFISANPRWMDYLEKQGRVVTRARRDLFANRLVLVARRGDPVAANIQPGFPLVRLLGPSRLALGDPDHVPAGIYARAALTSLGVWSSVERRLARTTNVRAALALVARGETRLGIVYLSDARAENRVRVAGEFPASSHPPIVYPGAPVADGDVASARTFLGFLAAPPAQALFRAAGFDTPQAK